MIIIDRKIEPKVKECGECYGPAEVVFKDVTEAGKDGVREDFVYKKPLLRCLDDNCGVVSVPAEARKALHDALCEASGLLTPDEIKLVRAEYAAAIGLKKISNKEFARHLGLGEITIARYESRSQVQNKAIDNLIRASLLEGFREKVVEGGRVQLSPNNVSSLDVARRKRNKELMGSEDRLKRAEAEQAVFSI